MPYYLTLPSGLTLPADGAKVALTTDCELHRDDSALPNALAVTNGEYRVAVTSDFTLETAAAQWTPASDPGLLHHWDVSAPGALTLENSNIVTQIANQVNGAPALVEWNAIQTAILTGTHNGRTIAVTDGTSLNHTLRTPVGQTVFPVDGNFAIHAVMRIDTVDSTADALIASNEGTNEFEFISNNATQFDGRINPPGAGASRNLTGGPYSGWINFSLIFNRTAGTADVFVGNTSRLSSLAVYTLSISTSCTLQLFLNRFTQNPMAGAVGEVLMTATLDNRADYYNWLNTRWGVA